MKLKTKRKILSIITKSIGRLFTYPNRIPVIYYHNVVQDGNGYSFMHTEVSIFKKHMEYLAKHNYRTFLFSEIPEGFSKSKNSKEVIITFDDGFRSNYSIVFPLMKRLGLKYNIFLTTGYLESDDEDYLTWEMVSSMHQSGQVEFGAHTHSHIDARRINERNFESEILNANEQIKRYSNIPEDMCFPYGYYDRAIVEKLSNAKIYKRLYTSDHMKPHMLTESHITGRAGISNDYDLKTFEDILKGRYNILYYYSLIRGTFTRNHRK